MYTLRCKAKHLVNALRQRLVLFVGSWLRAIVIKTLHDIFASFISRTAFAIWMFDIVFSSKTASLWCYFAALLLRGNEVIAFRWLNAFKNRWYTISSCFLILASHTNDYLQWKNQDWLEAKLFEHEKLSSGAGKSTIIRSFWNASIGRVRSPVYDDISRQWIVNA